MGLTETEGLVLRTYNLSDADKIAIFFTQEAGLVRGVAKGAKRLKSRFTGTLEPFSVVNLTYFQKEERDLVSIRQIELEKSYFQIAGNIEILSKFSYLADLLINFVPPHDPNERIYKMTKVSLQTISEYADSLESITFYFELWLLRLGGYLPDWEKCFFCRKTFLVNEKAYLLNDFQISCLNCRNVKSSNEIKASQRILFLTAQKLAPKNFYDFSKSKTAEIIYVSQILKSIISQTLGKEIKNQRILAVKK